MQPINPGKPLAQQVSISPTTQLPTNDTGGGAIGNPPPPTLASVFAQLRKNTAQQNAEANEAQRSLDNPVVQAQYTTLVRPNGLGPKPPVFVPIRLADVWRAPK